MKIIWYKPVEKTGYKGVFLLCFFLLNAVFIYAQPTARTEEFINSGWSFYKGNDYSPEKKNHNFSEWQTVTLPHTWNNVDSYYGKNIYRGIGWYRKVLKRVFSEANYSLNFGAAALYAEVYLNGKLIANHKGGYTAFTVNLSRHLKNDSVAVIDVKVDNSHSKTIAPIQGDFTIYGGLYRNVMLVKTSLVSFSDENYGSGGVKISTPLVSLKGSKVQVEGTIVNQFSHKKQLVIKNTIINTEGKEIHTFSNKITVQPNQVTNFNQVSNVLAGLKLWDPENPNLYRIKVQLFENGKEQDVLQYPLAFRKFRISADSGFYINDKRIKLTGFSRHQDKQGYGNALSDEIHEKDVKLMKEAGANFIRIAHYPQSPAILEACNRLGLIAWIEAPLVSSVDTSKAFKENAIQQVKEMMHQYYNHPSIAIWSYMNEVLINSERGKIPDELRPKEQAAVFDLAKELEKIIREADPYRITSMAFHDSQIYNESGLRNIPMTVAWNIYNGWYKETFADFDKFLDKERKNYPDKTIIISEYGAGSDLRINTLKPEIYDFSMQWQQMYVEHYLPAMQNRDFVAGSSAWIFADFGSDERQETISNVNNKGIVTFDRKKKDVFYYYKAFLRKDTGVVHIATRDWSYKKMTPLSVNEDFVKDPIKIYSNGAKVRLIVNGNDLGERETNNFHAIFDVPLRNGLNRLVAKSVYNGKEFIDETIIELDLQPYNLNGNPNYFAEIGVNAGSNTWFADEDKGFMFEPDKPYRPGSWGYVGGKEFRGFKNRVGTRFSVKGANQGALYQTSRVDLKSYKFDVNNGVYKVELFFSEPLGDNNDVIINDIGVPAQNPDKKPKRLFSVDINNQRYINQLNLLQEVGSRTLYTSSFMVEAINRKGLEVSFIPNTGETIINSIKIKRVL